MRLSRITRIILGVPAPPGAHLHLGFWTRCPAYLKENTSSMHETSDYVHMSITVGIGTT